MKSSKFYSYLIIYLLLLFKAGFFFVESFARYTNIFLMVLVFWYLTVKRRGLNKVAVIFAALTIFLELLTFVLKGFPEVEFFISCIVNLVLVVLVVSSIDLNHFKCAFSDINYVICIASLICFLLHFIGLPLYQICPLLINSHGEGGYFALFSIPRVEFSEWATYRIQGIYWEPGAFQFFIIVSAIIDLYRDSYSGQKRFFRIIIYVLTAILTFSTTGIIGSILVIFLYVYKVRKDTVVPLVTFASFIFLAIIYGLIDEDSYFYYSLFGKLNSINESYAYGSSSNESAEVRMNAFVYVLDEFLNSPIVGIGQSGNVELTRKGVAMTTFTPLNIFAFYGILLGLLHVIGITLVMRLKNKPFLEALLVFFILTLSTVSEQFAFNPILMCFSAYGYAAYMPLYKRRINPQVI